MIEVVANGYQCKVCFKIYHKPSHAKEHYSTTHADAGFEFVCSICENKVYANRKSLYVHLRDKHGVIYSCRNNEMDQFMRPKRTLPYID